MASSVLEIARSAHEYIERLEGAIVKSLVDLHDNTPKLHSLDARSMCRGDGSDEADVGATAAISSKDHRQRLIIQHRCKRMIDRIVETSKRLKCVYDDSDGSRASELAAMSADNAFPLFYERLTRVLDAHAQYPSARDAISSDDMQDDLLKDFAVTIATGSKSIVFPASSSIASLSEENVNYSNAMIDLSKFDNSVVSTLPEVRFSGEECLGKYVDCYALFDKWQNLRGVKEEQLKYLNLNSDGAIFDKVDSKSTADVNPEVNPVSDHQKKKLQSSKSTDYIAFLRNFTKINMDTSASPSEDEEEWRVGMGRGLNLPLTIRVRLSAEYRHYLESVIEYLSDFRRRSTPLFAAHQDVALKNVKDCVLESWQSGRLKDVVETCLSGTTHDNADATTEVDPLFCVACDKRFAKSTVFNAHLTGKKHLQACSLRSSLLQISANDSHVSNKNSNYLLRVIELETCVVYLGCMLRRAISATVVNIEKRQARTYEELAAEKRRFEEDPLGLEGDAVVNENDDGSDEEAPVWNPKGLPLGWDGKPIPYWLWKLHGLSVEYKCEICGDASYKGRRDFERHFTESRHISALRLLGISHSKEMYGITSVSDAMAVDNKLKSDAVHQMFNAVVEREVEDNDGTVYSKKVYDDLRRQGII